jgi:hypothetical protein
MIPARVRTGATWADMCILNISSRGMMLKGRAVPSRGSYLDIRSGLHAATARVVWTKGDRCGVLVQEVLSPDHFGKGQPPAAAWKGTCRRTSERREPAPVTHAESRLRGRAFEYLCFAILATAVAGGGFALVLQALQRPFGIVAGAMAKTKPG